MILSQVSKGVAVSFARCIESPVAGYLSIIGHLKLSHPMFDWGTFASGESLVQPSVTFGFGLVPFSYPV